MWSQEGKVSYLGTWWPSAFYCLHHSQLQRRKKTCRLEKTYYVDMDKYDTVSFTTTMKTFDRVDHCFGYNLWDPWEYSEATLIDNERTKVLFLRFVECSLKCLLFSSQVSTENINIHLRSLLPLSFHSLHHLCFFNFLPFLLNYPLLGSGNWMTGEERTSFFSKWFIWCCLQLTSQPTFHGGDSGISSSMAGGYQGHSQT